MNNETKRKIIFLLKTTLTAAAWTAAFAVLYAFGYITEIAYTDNFVGALPIVLAVICAGSLTALVWLKRKKRNTATCIVLSLATALSAALYPNAMRGNWWLDYYGMDSAGENPDISVYAPFAPGSLAAQLDEPSTLELAGDLPVMDGAIALYPVYAAFAQAVYRQSDYSPDHVRCTNTLKAYDSIIRGDADIIFCAAPSEGQLNDAKAAGVELCFTPIALEAFVFLVGNDNPTDNLTSRQIINVYSGRTAMWRTLGWEQGGQIAAFRRIEGSGSESGLINLVMKDRPTFVPQPLPAGSVNGTNSLMQQMSVVVNGVQPALGYSYRYFATKMYPNPGAKILKIDGCAPTDENIRSRKYPYVAEVYAVTRGEPQDKVKELLNWILSPQGQRLIQKTGYAPIC